MVGGVSTLSVHGQDSAAPKNGDESAEKWLLDEAVVITPRSEPVPALHYRLFPLASERKDGNAVPIYLRLGLERNDATKHLLRENTSKWNEMPLDKLPLDEIQKYVDHWQYNLREMELGARRKQADWNYALDNVRPIGILLPDVQEMRMWIALLMTKARLEIAQGQYEKAVRTLETGYAIGQHIAQGNFLINGLVAIAGVELMNRCALELVQRPDAPNLYWALSTMPRPLIDLRTQIEFEEWVQVGQFPELSDLDRPRTSGEWDATLARFRQEIEKLSPLTTEKGKSPLRPIAASADPAIKAPDLPAAKEYLAKTEGLTAAALEAMPASQVLLLYFARTSQEFRDHWFKYAYLPFPQARAYLKDMAERIHPAAGDTEGVRVAKMLIPAVQKVQLAQIRTERKLAALRVIEALRLYAAANQGRLPEKLSAITQVAVPNDPGTDRPFEYQCDGQTATLMSRIPDEQLAITGLRYRISCRK
jgi:hypothetical protein